MMANREKTKATSDAAEAVDRCYLDGKAETVQEEEKAEVARLVHDLRHQAGLTQKELATRIGTTASVISRLEDANYTGHSLTMLRRIAAVVGRSVQIRFVPLGRSPKDETDRTGKHLPADSTSSHPEMDRWPDEPLPGEEISAPFDIPRPGMAIRCTARPGPDRLPDPPFAEVGPEADHV